jgi:uncharacterized protein involved in response to NO
VTRQHSSQHSNSRRGLNAGLGLLLQCCLSLLAPAQPLTRWLAAVLVSRQAAVWRPRAQKRLQALVALLLLAAAKAARLVCQIQQQQQQQQQLPLMP